MSKTATKIPACSECDNKDNIFCTLTPEQTEMISENKGSNFYKKGQAVFYEGNQSHGLFCIHKGKVKLSKLGENGKEQVIRFAKTGNILGYRSLFSNEPYQATATVLEDSYICHLSKEKYTDIMKENSKLSWKTMQLLSKDLKSAEQHLINIAQKTVKERIAEALQLLHTTFGFLEDGKTLSIMLTRSEIADIAGTTTETTIRTLAILCKENAIELEGKRIIIPNISVLTKISGLYD
ncbi:MAG: Crp/Fnr family transcriptional regulator [Fluviicola sp.]|nr:Crp/Fnr family transcriptional regulator [Fluviicola sp.]